MDNITWEELFAMVSIVALTVGIILDFSIRVVGYTRQRQREFYKLSNAVSLLNDRLNSFEEERDAFIAEFRDIQGIIRKADLYKRERDNVIKRDQ